MEGIDGEKIKGRKRYISVDTLDNLVMKLHAANQSDTKEG